MSSSEEAHVSTEQNIRLAKVLSNKEILSMHEQWLDGSLHDAKVDELKANLSYRIAIHNANEPAKSSTEGNEEAALSLSGFENARNSYIETRSITLSTDKTPYQKVKPLLLSQLTNY